MRTPQPAGTGHHHGVVDTARPAQLVITFSVVSAAVPHHRTCRSTNAASGVAFRTYDRVGTLDNGVFEAQ
jgi:hypothetical protein